MRAFKIVFNTQYLSFNKVEVLDLKKEGNYYVTEDYRLQSSDFNKVYFTSSGDAICIVKKEEDIVKKAQAIKDEYIHRIARQRDRLTTRAELVKSVALPTI